jgi:hypothetical protein
MNPRALTREEVAEFARNVLAALAAGKVKGFSPEQVAELSASLTAALERLASADLKAVEAKTVYHAAITDASQAEAEVNTILTDIKFGMRSARSGAEEYKALGFDPPAEPGRIIEPQAPTDLTATGFSNGVNVLKFTGNNVPGRVTYAIEARESRDGDYVMIGLTRKQTFKHTPVTPGQFYQYRVRSEATRGLVSAWSNEAVVYPPK